jgi:hypothetical protein
MTNESLPGRTPTDGKPYYCALCGLGFGEFMACEESDCKLEDWDTARKRALPPCEGTP